VSDFIALIVFGIATGGIYALIGLGLVAVYRTSRVLNFGVAGIASLSVYIAHSLLQHHVPYGLVFLIIIAVGAGLSAITYLGYVQFLHDVTEIYIAVGTLGVLLVAQGLTVRYWGADQYAVPPLIRGSLTIGSITVSYNTFVIIATTALAIFAFLVLFYRTRFGIAMRATSSGPITASLIGINTKRVQLLAWLLSGALAAIAGLLIVPQYSLNPTILLTISLAAFAAVVMGGFVSPSGVLLGGVVLAVSTNILTRYVASDLSNTFVFIIIAIVLLARPNGLLGSTERRVPEPILKTSDIPVLSGRATPLSRGNRGRMSRWRRVAGIVVVLVALAVVPRIASSSLVVDFTAALLLFVVVVGLVVLQGDSGQLSLGQSGFMAVGAYVGAISVVHLHMTVWASLVLAVVAGAVMGALIGWPASRLSGVYLAVFTLAFGLAVPEIATNWTSVTNGGVGLVYATPSSLFASEHQYYLALVIAVVVGAVTTLLRRSRLGLAMRAARDSEPGAVTVGWSPTLLKTIAFSYAGALAAFGGALSALLIGFVSPGSYGVFVAIFAVVAVVIGGSNSVMGAIVGSLVVTLVPVYVGGNNSPDILYGLVLLAVTLVARRGIVEFVKQVARLLGRRRAPSALDETMRLDDVDLARARAGGPAQ